MRVWIPFRKDNAVLPLNTLSGHYGNITGTPGLWLRCMEAFHRKKDAVEFMEKQNTRTSFPFEYKIVCFESKVRGELGAVGE